MVVIPAVNDENDSKKLKIALYFPLFFFSLHTYLKYPPWLTHKNPAEIPPTVAPVTAMI